MLSQLDEILLAMMIDGLHNSTSPNARPRCPRCGRRIPKFAKSAKSAVIMCQRLRTRKGQKACR